jgi:hypothetical protein
MLGMPTLPVWTTDPDSFALIEEQHVIVSFRHPALPNSVRSLLFLSSN